MIASRRAAVSSSQVGQQVGGVVGLHGLEDVGGALGLQARDDVDLVVLGQLLEDVGELLVVEGGRDLPASLGRHGVEHLGEVGGLELVERGEQARGALRARALGDEAAHLVELDEEASRPGGGAGCPRGWGGRGGRTAG